MSGVPIVVIGGGHLGRVHARVLRGLDGAQLLGVVEPLAEVRAKIAADLGVPVFESFADVPQAISAAVVATPTVTHRDVALPLIERGMHVLIEKPMAPDVAAAEQLVTAARLHDVIVQVGHVERFNPAWQAVREQVAQPKFIEARRFSTYSFRSTDIGVVHDVMIHDLDLVRSLVSSPVVDVQAMGVSIFGHHEDVAQVRLAFAEGCVATLSASRVSYAGTRWFQVWNAQGVTTLDLAARTAASVRMPSALARHELDVDALPPDRKATLKEQLFEELLPIDRSAPAPSDAITAELRDFLSSIRLGHEPQVTGADALETLRLAERILEAIEHHRWDGTPEGRIGPFAQPARQVLRGPHWDIPKPTESRPRRREAG